MKESKNSSAEVTAYLGLGSNLADREKNIKRAIEKLNGEEAICVSKASSFYETEPQGIKNQPHFINCVLEIKTTLSPAHLLKKLKSIESELGRTPTVRWGPRIIDIDILQYEDIIINEDNLKIPHPLMSDRSFVLRGLSEIAPTLKHPISGKTAEELLNQTAGVEYKS